MILMTDTDTTISTAAKLRLLADLIDAHPDLPHPYISAYSSGDVDIDWFLHTKTKGMELAEQKATAALVVSTLGGQWDKDQHDTDFTFTQRRDGITMRVVVTREAVCKRVVVGHHEITEPAVPARPAMKALPAAVSWVEDVEWRCSSLLGDTDQSAS